MLFGYLFSKILGFLLVASSFYLTLGVNSSDLPFFHPLFPTFNHFYFWLIFEKNPEIKN